MANCIGYDIETEYHSRFNLPALIRSVTGCFTLEELNQVLERRGSNVFCTQKLELCNQCLNSDLLLEEILAALERDETEASSEATTDTDDDETEMVIKLSTDMQNLARNVRALARRANKQ